MKLVGHIACWFTSDTYLTYLKHRESV